MSLSQLPGCQLWGVCVDPTSHLACCWKSQTGESVFPTTGVVTGASAPATANDTQLLGAATSRSVKGLPEITQH